MGRQLLHASEPLANEASLALQRLFASKPAVRATLVQSLLQLLLREDRQDDVAALTVLRHVCALLIVWDQEVRGSHNWRGWQAGARAYRRDPRGGGGGGG